ncbi:hypothetical protein CMT19_15695 [Elizabethkingia anophelis]|nr:hypothetical protein [Elizabethkingia anophelis]
MDIEQGIKEFLKKLAIYLGHYDVDMELSYDTDTLEAFFSNLNDLVHNSHPAKVILDVTERFILDNSVTFTDLISSYSNITKMEVVHLSRRNDTKHRVRNFVCNTTSGSIIPIKYFNDSSIYPISDSDKLIIERKIRELFLYLSGVSITQADFKTYLDKINNNEKNTVLAIYSSNTSFSKLYTKCYLKYLLTGNKTIFPSEVMHSFTNDSTTLGLLEASTNDFTQFFEICDVIDEYHHSSDLLVKYLKLYQIIEYFITRAILVKIQENNSNQNLFLREMTGLSKFDDFDKNNFNLVFKSNEVDLGNWFMNFLSGNSNSKLMVEKLLYNNTKTIDITKRNNCYNALLNTIYKLRNSIVHNKESEVHFTIHNILLKKEIIKLVKEIMKKFEKILFEKMIGFEAVISYRRKTLELY